MNDNLQKKFDDALWIASSLFSRGKTSGSSANLSFRHGEYIYVTGTGTCFGRLTEDEFSKLDVNGRQVNGISPSKEFPLHLMLYNNNDNTGAVIHTHSFYTTLWSCYRKNEEPEIIPQYTPYLEMKLGQPAWVPYAPPGSALLFEAFKKCLDSRNGYILRNHGPIVAGKNLLEAFFALEELEESARLAWELRDKHIKEAISP
jgi:ribulose-5-phosphate 4-epimerase/fuculose-1-phosphate aldolase